MKNNLPPRKDNSNPGFNKYNTNYTNLLKTPVPKLDGLNFEGNIGETNITFQVDTEAHKSFISEKLTKPLKLQIDNHSTMPNVQIATGQIVECIGTSNICFTLKRIPAITFRTTVDLIPGDLDIVLLGESFLVQKEVMIDYRDTTIRMAEHHTFLGPLVKEFHESPDHYILNCALSTETVSSPLKDNEKALILKHSVLGTIPNHSMKITLKQHDEIRARTFGIAYKLQERFKTELQRLLDLGIIVKSNSPYSCPAFTSIKKNGSTRFIVDYRKINRYTVLDSCQFPNMHEELRSIPQSN